MADEFTEEMARRVLQRWLDQSSLVLVRIVEVAGPRDFGTGQRHYAVTIVVIGKPSQRNFRVYPNRTVPLVG